MRQRLISRLFLVLLAGVFVGCAPRPYQPGPALNSSAFMQVVETLTAPEMQGRDAGSDGIDLARDFLVDRFKSLGLKPAFVIDGKPSYTQPLIVRTGKDAEDNVIEATVENVGAILPGSGSLKDQVIVIGGHYDHVGYGHYGSRAPDMKGQLHPGADDNASGTAGVLLLARHFALQHHNDGKPRRTLFFTGFAAEERGLIGSRYMVQHPDQYAFDAKQVNGMINLDMIGRLRGDDLYIFADETGEQWRGWVKDANRDVGLNLKWDVRPPGGSDHSMFISVGIPAVFFNTWLHDDYHTPRDTADTINGQGGAMVLQVVANLTERAVTEPGRITFVPPKPRAPRPYVGAKLGQAEAGVLIEDVLIDGPLDKAGAKNGDVLLSIQGKAMTSPGDVRAFLAEAKAGTEVKIQIQRGEQTLDLTVLLGVRP